MANQRFSFAICVIDFHLPFNSIKSITHPIYCVAVNIKYVKMNGSHMLYSIVLPIEHVCLCPCVFGGIFRLFVIYIKAVPT